MSSYWKLGNKVQGKGQLNTIKETLPGHKNLVAFSMSVPLSSSDPKIQKNAILSAAALAGPAIRSFEIWWDSSKKEVNIVIVSPINDMENFKQAFLDMYPSTEFVKMETISPSWFDPNKDYKIFDVGTQHGHNFAMFDQANAHKLITLVVNNIQLSKHAWIQFVFKSHNFNQHLQFMTHRINKKYDEMNHKTYISLTDQIIKTNPKPKEDPEKGFDFYNNYKILTKHATTKAQGNQMIISIRGIFEYSKDIDMDFNIIESVPFEIAQAIIDYLTKYEYPFDDFRNNGKKKNEITVKFDKKEKLQRYEILTKRLIPKPTAYLQKARSEYLEKTWTGKYRIRNPLPFLILNTSETSLLIHLPDPLVKNIKTTRGVTIPSKPPNKHGFKIGYPR